MLARRETKAEGMLVLSAEKLRADHALVKAAAAAGANAGATSAPATGRATARSAARGVAAEGFDENDRSTWGNPGRNDPCPCGSGKKFKHCHGRLA